MNIPTYIPGLLGAQCDGSREKPYFLILHENTEQQLAENGYNEGDLIGLVGGWWKITFSRYIPRGIAGPA